MTLIEQTYAQAVLLAGTVTQEQKPLLELFCRSAVTNLSARLREGLTPEKCEAEIVAAGALYALAALAETDETANLQRVQVGDVTLIPGGVNTSSRCLRKQADMLILPYCGDNLVFRRV